MKLRSFIFASVIIHLAGGLILYFYYNPISVSKTLKTKDLIEREDNDLISNPTKEKKLTTKPLNKKRSSFATKKTTPNIKKQREKPKLSIKKKKRKTLDKTEQHSSEDKKNLSEQKESVLVEEIKQSDSLSSGNQKTPVETKETPQESIEMEEIEQEPVLPRQNQISPSFSSKGNPSKQQANPQESIEVEEIEQEPALPRQNQTSPSFSSKDNPSNQQANPQESIEVEEIDGSAVRQKEPLPQTALELPVEKEIEREEIETEELEIEETTAELKVSLDRENITNQIKTSSSKTVKDKQKIKNFSQLVQKSGNPSLVYPDFARETGMQGLISILFYVTETGLVDKLQLELSSGYSELDNFVIRNLSKYKFSNKEAFWVRYKKQFVLQGEESQFLRLRETEDSP